MNTRRPHSPQSEDTNKLSLGNHLDFIRSSAILQSRKSSTFDDRIMKENILDGEDCNSNFEHTMFLENSSRKTWKKKKYIYQSSQILRNPAAFLQENEVEDRFSDKAIQLISVDPHGNFKVTEEGISFLQKVEGPIVVLGVAGMYRTGKSYLLNKVILRSAQGFGVAPTINACTKGIWIYGKPFNVKLNDGRYGNLIVMDSEGLGALDQDSGHDCRVFALVLLLSSVFLYNSVGTIDENAISSLSLVINLTRHIKIRSKTKTQNNNCDEEDDDEDEDEEDPAELAKFFPSFLWVLRDFSLELKDGFEEEISAKQYLENALALHKGISDEVERKNRVRRMIKQFFPDRNCFPLVRPLVDEDDLQRLNDLPIEKLRPEFISQSLELRELVFSSSKTKKMQSKEINGAILAGLAEQYVKAINGGAVPNIESAWTYVCSAQKERLVIELGNGFDRQVEGFLAEKIPIEEEELVAMIKDLRAETKKRFLKEALDGVDREEMMKLKAKLQAKSVEIVTENEKAMEMLVGKVLIGEYNERVSSVLQRFNQSKDKKKKEEIEGMRRSGFGLMEEKEAFGWVDREASSSGVFGKCFQEFQQAIKGSLGRLTPKKARIMWRFISE